MIEMSVDTILMDYISANPGVGLYECAEHLRSAAPDMFVRVMDPVRASRTKACNRLNSMYIRGILRRENPSGKKAIYYINED